MAETSKSSAGNTVLSPLHLPQPGHTGIAMHHGESAYPEMWKGHCVSVCPCFSGWGDAFPIIGFGPSVEPSSTKGQRQWGWQGSVLENHFEPSPIGPGFYTGPGATVTVKNGFKHVVPWEYQEGVSQRPHTYVFVFMLPTTHEVSTFQFLFANNARPTINAPWRGETLVFNTETMSLQIWFGGNTNKDEDIGCNMVFTQDDALTALQWHTAAWTVNGSNNDNTDQRLFIDGFEYTSSWVQNGTYGGDAVYSQANQVRMFDEAAKSSNDLAISLFQVFERPMCDTELAWRSQDPLAMFWPRAIQDETFGQLTGTKLPHLGRLAGMRETVLAATSE